MAFRRHVVTKKNTFWSITLKVILTLCSLFGIIALGAILYFNGNTIKEPLENYVSKALGNRVSIESVEFSPIYPDTLKLNNISFLQSHIDELYIEYDLYKAFSEHNLYIDYLYLKKPQIEDSDLKVITDNSLKFNKVNANRVRIENIELNSERLKAQDAKLNLNEVNVTDTISYKSASYALTNGSFDNVKFSDLSFNLVYDRDTILLKDLYVKALGGSIQGDFKVDGNTVTSDNVNFNNLVIQDNLESLNKFSFNIKKAFISKSFVKLYDTGLSLSSITGDIENLKLNNGSLSLLFKGNIDEIITTNTSLNLTDVTTTFNLNNNKLDFEGQAYFLEGDIALSGSANLNEHNIDITVLELNKNKLAFDSYFNESLNKTLDKFKVNITSAKLTDLEFLSYINKLPVSIERINGTISGLAIDKDTIKGAPAALINLETDNLLYKDLYIKHIYVISTLTDNLFTLSVPDITFNKSSISLIGDIAYDKGRSYLLVHCNDFDVSELNSSLIDSLFAGQIDLEIELKSSNFKNFVDDLEGNISLSSDSLLISKFGLDLINGGDSKVYKLKKDELLTALADEDVGLYELKVSSDIKSGVFDFDIKSDLTTSSLTANFVYNLKTNKHNLVADFISYTKGNTTHVTEKGHLTDATFTITPQKRAEKLSGLFINKDESRTDDKSLDENKVKDKITEKANAKTDTQAKIPNTVQLETKAKADSKVSSEAITKTASEATHTATNLQDNKITDRSSSQDKSKETDRANKQGKDLVDNNDQESNKALDTYSADANKKSQANRDAISQAKAQIGNKPSLKDKTQASYKVAVKDKDQTSVKDSSSTVKKTDEKGESTTQGKPQAKGEALALKGK